MRANLIKANDLVTLAKITQPFYSVNSLLIAHCSSLRISSFLTFLSFSCLGHENKLDPTAVRFPYEDDILIFNQSRLMINLEGTVYRLDSKNLAGL